MRRLLLVLLVAFTLFATPAQAAYNHVEVCKATLRGYFGSDDDVHMFGVSTGANGFSGWGTYWHGDSGGVCTVTFMVGCSLMGWVIVGMATTAPTTWASQYGLGHCWLVGDYGRSVPDPWAGIPDT
jgi:hypothetical protein